MIPFGVGMSQFVAERHVCGVGRNKALKAAGNKKRRALQKARKQEQEAKWTAIA
jgi:hypothetical protein